MSRHLRQSGQLMIVDVEGEIKKKAQVKKYQKNKRRVDE